MNRMLFLRDIENDVLIRCRACGHEGVLTRAEAERRFGPSYPVLSIAPHFRCSACNARDAESCAAPLAEEPQVSHVATPPGDDDDAGFAATLAALQGLVEAAHAPPPAPRRAAPPPPPPPPLDEEEEEEEEDDEPPAWGRGWAIADRDPPAAAFAPEPEPEPEPEIESSPEPSPWDVMTDADAEEDAPAWMPPPAPPPRPALPPRPFFASRERRDTEDDDDAAPLSLAQVQALLADDDAGPSLADMVAIEAPPPAPDEDDDGPPADAFPEEGPLEDEDDPLLSSTLQRLLRHAPTADDNADAEAGDDMGGIGAGDDVDAGGDMDVMDAVALPPDPVDGYPADGPDADDAHDVIANVLRAGGEEEPELTDEELIAFAIGDHDENHDPGDLPPELAALLTAGDPLAADLDDEDEVYEYQPGEIMPDEPGDEGEPVIPRNLLDTPAPDDAFAGDWLAAPPEPEPEPEVEPELEPEVEPEPEPESPPAPRLLDEDDDLADFPDPPAWKTQRPPPSADDEGGMEDALSTLRALIEKAAAEPEAEADAEAEPEAPGDESPAAPSPRPSPLDDDDDLSWEALMREVAAKAGETADDDRTGEAADDDAPPEPPVVDIPEPPAATKPPAARSSGSLGDTLSRLRGLLDLPADAEAAPHRPPKKRR